MSVSIPLAAYQTLQNKLAGELFFDQSPEHEARKLIYATDASSYQEKPQAVAIPQHTADLKLLIDFAQTNGITLIPRTAGTSLAGQVVGNGLVVDCSTHFTQLLEVNPEERWVRVQPGVIRDDLNVMLRPYGLFFGPETSTANRAMIGGMIGNNSCGLHSIVWGDTRQHLVEASVLLSDGSEAVFKSLTSNELTQKMKLPNLEGKIYRETYEALGSPETVALIEEKFPKKTLKRRNTGYALDLLTNAEVFREDSHEPFNFCRLLAGSEGTLAFITEAKLRVLPLPPAAVGVVCIHCRSIQEALQANLVALQHQPMASELVDKFILDFTVGHPTYQANRFFIEGDPAAILMVEFMAETPEMVQQLANQLITNLINRGIGYAHPLVMGEATKLVWDVRKAGLGLIRNMKGDVQPVNLIEDCAVSPEDLPAYIADSQALLAKHGVQASYYAHAGAGELHVEPLLNLKTAEGNQLFRQILKETAELVKKYNGSLSGEHGDGRLRGEFIPAVLGEEVYELFVKVKQIFDPKQVFNANKIVHTPPMNESLRYVPNHQPLAVTTHFDFTEQESILKMAEKCSGSGDCRKTSLSGGTMCPSFMATRQEKDSTRARANILRHYLTNPSTENPFNQPEIKEVMDLCLSCKACKSECPSKVDVAKMKAEFLQQYYAANGVPLRTWLIGHFTQSQALGSIFPSFYNLLTTNKLSSQFIKNTIGFASERSLPLLAKEPLRKWFSGRRKPRGSQGISRGKVAFFCDEFTNYNDAEIGQKAIELLERLGFEVLMPSHRESGRTYLSKGLVNEAKKLANHNVKALSALAMAGVPIVGVEPSAILTLRDEYVELVPSTLAAAAKKVAEQTFTIEEFLAKIAAADPSLSDAFVAEPKQIKLHGHCYQKALSSVAYTQQMLSLPRGYDVKIIPSGCCGMAGSFGYEKEHYELSMQVGELVLFPAVRKLSPEVIVAASGTSCRHQIKDGTNRQALHPVEILWEALLPIQ